MPSYTEEEKRRAIGAVEECGGSVTRAMRCLGYRSRQTLYQWLNHDGASHERRAGRPWSHYDPVLKEQASRSSGRGCRARTSPACLGCRARRWPRLGQGRRGPEAGGGQEPDEADEGLRDQGLRRVRWTPSSACASSSSRTTSRAWWRWF